MGRIPLVKSPLATGDHHHGDQVDDAAHLTTQDETLFDNPQFQHYEATSNIQLFFDLFFVANLASFTIVHEINSRETLASYIGFICVLWFTWCQVTLYDVRFATDSILERVAHACHFGVMIGLAVVGPNFLTSHDGWGPLQQLSIMLMASRLVLFCQYGSTLFFTWRYRKTRAPLVAIMMSLLVAALIYLGISFVFYKRVGYESYIAWYVIAVVEVLVNVIVASVWPAVSLWKTHLVERMTCLTLIILGEGILGLTKIIVKIQKLDGKFTPADIGMLISAVLIIYLFYQLYFDNIRLSALSARRQHLSAILHFPFHLALCLTMEGVNQTLLWAHIVGSVNAVFHPLENALLYGTTKDLRDALTTVLNDVFSRFETTNDVFEEVQHAFEKAMALGPKADPGEFTVEALPAMTEAMKTVIENFGWETPVESHGEGIEGLLNAYNAVISVFNITFGYFAVCSGLILILISVFSVLSLPHNKQHYHLRYISTLINVLVGLGIALLTILTTTMAAELAGETPWILPALMLILLFLLILNHIPRGYYKAVIDEKAH